MISFTDFIQNSHVEKHWSQRNGSWCTKLTQIHYTHYKLTAYTTGNYTNQNKMNKSMSCMDRLFRDFQPNQFSPPQQVASKTYLLTRNNLFISSSSRTYLALDTSQEESYNTGLETSLP